MCKGGENSYEFILPTFTFLVRNRSQLCVHASEFVQSKKFHFEKIGKFSVNFTEQNGILLTMLQYADYTDEQLLELLKAGNEAAFTELFHRYDNRIYFFTLKMIKDEETAREITQEIFIKIWERRDRLNNIENPQAYILTIAANHTLSRIRKQLSEKKMLERLATLMKEKIENSTDDQILFRESETLVTQAVKRLPAQQQKVYHLSREQGYNYAEIAEIMDISPNTVRNHLVEARRSIRLYLEKNGDISIPLIAMAIFIMQ